MERTNLESWLKEERSEVLEDLWRRADDVRRNEVGDEVHLRGLIEISNYCVRQCHYCGLRAGNAALNRYRMTMEEILSCAQTAVRFEYGTVVLQAGEDPNLTQEWVSELIQSIKKEYPLAVTLSLGERTVDDLSAWREVGADRYLLRFETSNAKLFRKIHPAKDHGTISDRIGFLKELGRIGYEVGSGVIVGVPGQTYQDLVRDLELFRELDLDMIGVGPFIPHPATPLGKAHNGSDVVMNEQVPATELMTYKMIALARLCCPHSNIPSTTALATLNIAGGRELGLQRGANVLMPNLTPSKYRVHYEIYPHKACIRETADQCQNCMQMRIKAIGRVIGRGSGRASRQRNPGVQD